MRVPTESFRAQAILIAMASASLAGLAGVFVWDTAASTEKALVENARQQCFAAVRELERQYVDRARVREERLEDLPAEARDLSLEGIASAVLRSYEGVAGGFVWAASGRIVGVSGVPEHEKPVLVADHEARLIEMAGRQNRRLPLELATIAHDRDLTVLAIAGPVEREPVAWVSKRLVRARDPIFARRWWLAGLIASMTFGVTGIILISVRLRSGVESISQGLRRLEEDFGYRLPAVRGDFEEIARSINQMAERRAALEAGLRRQDRLAALGKVVAGVAHEIRNPLNSIRLTLELLGRRVHRGTVTTDEIAAAIGEVDRLERILARFLAFGRPEFEDRHIQDVRPLLERAVKMVQHAARAKGLDVSCDPAVDGQMNSNVDGIAVEQVLINLMLNAIDASPSGAPVRVETASDKAGIRITVRDCGPGIPEAIRDHIFDPYFTTKEGGTGLGLAVSQEVTAKLGGKLDFESGPGGTAFTLALPIAGGSSDEIAT